MTVMSCAVWRALSNRAIRAARQPEVPDDGEQAVSSAAICSSRRPDRPGGAA
jgi:hypothetical protein